MGSLSPAQSGTRAPGCRRAADALVQFRGSLEIFEQLDERRWTALLHSPKSQLTHPSTDYAIALGLSQALYRPTDFAIGVGIPLIF
jgi:hypothetical protein